MNGIYGGLRRKRFVFSCFLLPFGSWRPFCFVNPWNPRDPRLDSEDGPEHEQEREHE